MSNTHLFTPGPDWAEGRKDRNSADISPSSWDAQQLSLPSTSDSKQTEYCSIVGDIHIYIYAVLKSCHCVWGYMYILYSK